MRLYGSGDLRARFESLPKVAKEIVALSGINSQLTALRDLSSQPASSAFLRGLLEFWWDSTNTFHFPWGEMTVTPFDFSMITGFPFGGEPVVIELVKGSNERLRDLVGDRLASALHVYAQSCPYSVLADELSADELDRQCTPEQLARIYIAHVLSVTILSDRGERFAIGLLICLSDLGQVGDLSWAEVSYARMLTAMGKATRVMDSAAATEVPRISLTWHGRILEVRVLSFFRLLLFPFPLGLSFLGFRLGDTRTCLS